LKADGQADEVRRLEKEVGKLQLKLGVSEQARERIENHLDKNNSLFKANIRELDAAHADLEKQTIERKLAMEALRDSEEKYRILLEESSDPIFSFYPDGQYRYVNRAFANTVGKKPEDIIGRKIWDVFSKEEADKRFANIKWVCENGKGREIEVRVPRPDGDHYFLTTANPVFDDQGRVISVISISKNITERKKAEEARRASEELWKFALEGSGDGVWDWNIKTGEAHFSKRYKEMLGFTESEMGNTASEWSNRVHPEDVSDTMEKIQAHIDGKTPTGITEFRMLRKDGSWQWTLGRGMVVSRDADGKPLRLVGTNTDITERKLAEIELREAKEQAESATKLKDKFISLVAHDLRSPFASMLGLIRIYAEGNPSVEGGDGQKILERVFKSGERMISMIDNLLKISRLQTGQITPDPWFFKGHTSAANTIGSLSHTAAQKGIETINKVPPDTRLYADQTLFDEVLLNLLSNAIKFCARGDTITFFVPPGLSSAIAVRDTGKGIDEKTISNLFRHEVTTTTPGTAGETGTGLGLPFSRDIMKAHGGELTVESVPGEGSVFCAILPYAKPVALVVDDDPMSMLALRSHLEKIDIEVMEAVNGEKALSAMKDKLPHIIITDVNMPEMDGLALLDRLKQDSATSGIPVIVMTASGDGAMREKALMGGADDFASKPVTPEEFISRVRRFVG
jgi:PAS domain S-box-containing protein